MDEIINAILALPAITQENDSESIFIYEQFIKIVLKFNRTIARIWLQLFDEKIKNEDLLPITIAMLPANQALLDTIMLKIDIASRLSSVGIHAYVLTNLYSAALGKKNELSGIIGAIEHPEASKKKYDQTILEYQRNSMIRKLRMAAKIYKSTLTDVILEFIKMANPFIYNHHAVNYREKYNDHKIVVDLDSFSNHTTFRLLNLKMIIISDMLITLYRKSKREEILLEFERKYEHHSTILSQTDEKQGEIVINKLLGLFNRQKSPEKSAEEQFVQTAKESINSKLSSTH